MAILGAFRELDDFGVAGKEIYRLTESDMIVTIRGITGNSRIFRSGANDFKMDTALLGKGRSVLLTHFSLS